MIRMLFRLVILMLVLVAVGAVLLGWRPAGWNSVSVGNPPEVSIDTARAREVGAELGNKAAQAASQAQVALADGSITAKIKAKMALDDLVQAKDIHVDYAKGVVTLTGTVATQAERKRAVQLAAETKGVTSVTDRLRQPER